MYQWPENRGAQRVVIAVGRGPRVVVLKTLPILSFPSEQGARDTARTGRSLPPTEERGDANVINRRALQHEHQPCDGLKWKDEPDY